LQYADAVQWKDMIQKNLPICSMYQGEVYWKLY
jgi:hypothetical protein